MSNASVPIEAKRSPAPQPSDQPAPGGEVVISCDDTVPPSLEAELEQLYHHINSSLCHHAVARRARNAYAYVARRGAEPLAIFLFQREDRSVEVFNEMMQLPPEEIERFASYIFKRFPSVARVSFSKIGKEIGALSLPWQQYGQAEDIVVRLPETLDAYFSGLGAKTRRNIRYQMKAIATDFPGFSFQTYENDAIAAHHVAALIELKRANMNEKRIKFGIKPEEASWLTELAKTNGLLVLALLDGKVCGGSLSFRLGDHYFALLNGYDARFAKYSLGMLCCYLAMTEKIQRGAREAHLLWGRNQYKFKLLGVARDVANLDVYRSRLLYCRYFKRVGRNALDNLVQRQKWKLLENEQRRGFLPALLSQIVKIMRRIKRSNFRPAS
jgi:Acetyltransferase (GNAT) domain